MRNMDELLMTRKFIRGRFLSVLLSLIILGFAAHLTHQFYFVARAQLAAAPTRYTVILHENTYSPTGALGPSGLYTYAVRSDGSRVYKGSSGHFQERNIEFANGNRVKIGELLELKISDRKEGTHPARWHRDPTTQCLRSLAGTPIMPAETLAGMEDVNGYRAVKITLGGSVSWHALEYGCALLRLRMTFGDGGYSEKTLIALIPGEPAQELFNVPESFREVSPSEYVIALRQKQGLLPYSSEELKRYTRLDQNYNARRPR